MDEIREKIRTFIEDCLSEYPSEADWIKVEISARWGKSRRFVEPNRKPALFLKGGKTGGN